LCDPALETIEQRSILLFDRVDALLLSDVVVVTKVFVEVDLKCLVSDESLAAIGALEFDALIELSDCNDV